MSAWRPGLAWRTLSAVSGMAMTFRSPTFYPTHCAGFSEHRWNRLIPMLATQSRDINKLRLYGASPYAGIMPVGVTTRSIERDRRFGNQLAGETAEQGAGFGALLGMPALDIGGESLAIADHQLAEQTAAVSGRC